MNRWEFLDAARMRLPFPLILAGILFYPLTFACSSGGEQSSQLDTSIVSEADLSGMALTEADIAAFGPYRLDDSLSGVRTTDDILRDSFDKTRDARRFKDWGAITAYYSSFVKDETQDPAGIFFVSTGVTLFETSEGARLSLIRGTEDTISDIGRSNGSAALIAAETEDPGDIGANFSAVTVEIETSGDQRPDYSNTVIAFTIGRILGTVSVASIDLNADLVPHGKALAEKLSGRVTSVVEASTQ
jgi:hypothetical protein